MAPKAKRAAAKFRVGPAAQEGPQFVADLQRIFDNEPDSLHAIARVIIHCQGIPINQVAPRAILEELLQNMHNVSGPGGDKEILCSAKTLAAPGMRVLERCVVGTPCARSGVSGTMYLGTHCVLERLFPE